MTLEQRKALAMASARLRLKQRQDAPIEEAPYERSAREVLETTPGELIAGSAPVRFAVGAASPILGAAQAGAELFGDTTGTETLSRFEEMKRRGMKAYGQEGTDVIGMGGAAMSPVWLKAAKALPVAKGVGAGAKQGAAVGTAAGVSAPQTGDEFSFGDTAKAAGAGFIGGGVVGGGIPLAIKAGKAGYHLAEPYFNKAAIKGRAFLEAAGDKADEIMALLRENKELVPGSAPTAGEAAAGARSAEFSAMQKQAESALPTPYVARGDQQNAARLGALRSVGGDEASLNTARATRQANAKEAYGAVADDLINPKSDTSIMLDAVRARHLSKAHALRDEGRFATIAAQQQGRADKFYPVEGQPRFPGRYSANAERVPEAKLAATDTAKIAKYRQKELVFLDNTMRLLEDTVGLDKTGLHQFLGRPSMRAAVQDAVKGAKERGAYFPKEKGQRFSVANLQRIKESLDDMVSDPATFGIKATEAREIGDTRSSFVKWLSNKSPKWRDARLQYSSDSRPINQMEIGQELERRLVPALSDDAKQRAGTYATALRDAPRTIKKATGSPRFESLKDVLDPKALQTVESIHDDLARGASVEYLATKGQAAGPSIREIATESMERGLGGKPPVLLHRPMMFLNFLLRRLEGKLNKKMAIELSAEMLNPPKVAETMAQARFRQTKIDKLVDELHKYHVGAIGGITSGTAKEAESP